MKINIYKRGKRIFTRYDLMIRVLNGTFILMAVIVLLFAGYLLGRYLYPNKKIMQPAAPETVLHQNLNKTIILPKDIIITLYHPTTKECGNDKNITASGEKGRIGGVACSNLMFYKYVDFMDSIIILSGSLKGKYVVNDVSNYKGFGIDVYQNLDSKKSDCYKSKIKIIKKRIGL